MEKVSNAAGAKLRDLKRRKDFDEMILPARKVARTAAERKATSRSGRTPEQVDKERADDRVAKVTRPLSSPPPSKHLKGRLGPRVGHVT